MTCLIRPRGGLAGIFRGAGRRGAVARPAEEAESSRAGKDKRTLRPAGRSTPEGASVSGEGGKTRGGVV